MEAFFLPVKEKQDILKCSLDKKNNILVVHHNYEKESLNYELREQHVVLWKRKSFIDWFNFSFLSKLD